MMKGLMRSKKLVETHPPQNVRVMNNRKSTDGDLHGWIHGLLHAITKAAGDILDKLNFSSHTNYTD